MAGTSLENVNQPFYIVIDMMIKERIKTIKMFADNQDFIDFYFKNILESEMFRKCKIDVGKNFIDIHIDHCLYNYFIWKAYGKKIRIENNIEINEINIYSIPYLFKLKVKNLTKIEKIIDFFMNTLKDFYSNK